MAMLCLHGLTKRFTAVTAVNKLDLEVADGELVALLGPSGCGKTTTLRCIAGFELPDEGTITFGDHDVTYLPPERRNIGMVFQSYALFPHKTVVENVAYGLERRKIPRTEIARRVAEVLEKVQLNGMEKRYPRQLSGGQQQRVALARALVISPDLLLLDEPLANLDAKLREEMRFYIRSLQKEVGITTIYVTHDQAEAMVIADRIAVMFGGKVDQLGNALDVYKTPLTRRVADFIGLTNFIPGTMQERQGSLCLVKTPAGEIYCAWRDFDGGEKCFVAVRPESVQIATEPTTTPGWNCIEGRVRTRAYLGNLIDYRVEVAEDVVVRIQSNPDVLMEVGQSVYVEFPAISAWLLEG